MTSRSMRISRRICGLFLSLVFSVLTSCDYVFELIGQIMNQPPIIVFAENQIEGLVGSPVVIDASESRDPDSNTLTFVWTFSERPEESSLSEEDITLKGVGRAEFIPDVAGTFVIELGINDGFALIKGYVNIDVSNPPGDFGVWYYGNGATDGSPPPTLAYEYGEIVTIADNGTLARDGYSFSGWNTSADGTGVSYQPGNTFTMEAEAFELFAQWSWIPVYDLSPRDGGTLSNDAPILSWALLQESEHIWIQISQTDDFSAIVEESMNLSAQESSYQVTVLLENSQWYYWRIRGDYNSTWLSWSPTYSFYVYEYNVDLSLPPDGETIADTAPTIAWNHNTLAQKYHLIVADNVDFATPLIDAGDVSTTNYTLSGVPPELLSDSTTYYWKVALIDSGEIERDYSDIWSFTIDLGSVSSISPANGASSSDTTPILTWTANTNAEKYRVQIDDSINFSSPIVDRSDVQTNSYELNALEGEVLSNGVTYFWKVALVDANGVQGQFSVAFSFTVNIGSVLPISPANGSSTEDITPTLTWTANTNAQTYRVRVDNSIDFSSPIIDRSDVLTNSYELDVLEGEVLTDGVTYFWQVAIVDANGVEGAFFTAVAFTVQIPIPNLLMPEDLSTIQETIPMVSWEDLQNAGLTYIVEIALDAGFSTLVDSSYSVAGTEYNASNVLDNGTTYYWHVAAITSDGVQGQFSDTWSFIVDIGTVQLTSPTNASTVSDTAPPFEWEPNPTAESYLLQIADSLDFTSLMVEIDTITENFYTLSGVMPELLEDDGQYYWRVAPIDGYGVQGTFSNAYNFSVNIYYVEPLSPLSDEMVYANIVTFDWSDNQLAASYRLIVSESASFDSPSIDEYTSLSEYTTSGTGDELFINNIPYYWKLQMLDASTQVLTETEPKVFRKNARIRVSDILFDSVELRNAVISAGAMYADEAMEVRCNSAGVISLRGLEYLENCTWLELGDNSISDLEPLTYLTGLQHLQVQYNLISSLDPLSALVDLEYLNITNNFISNISALNSMINLRGIQAQGNLIADISPIANKAQLTQAQFAFNQVTEIPDLSLLSKLYTFAAYNNQIADIQGLSGCLSLEEIFLNNNNITNVSPMKDLPKLLQLGLSNNPITSASVRDLANLTTLGSLHLEGVTTITADDIFFLRDALPSTDVYWP